jgi:hypothetical protein
VKEVVSEQIEVSGIRHQASGRNACHVREHGIQVLRGGTRHWIPAFAGMTGLRLFKRFWLSRIA